MVLYNAVAATSPWAAIYFIAIIVFGKNVLLNVLVGIGVDSFQARVRTVSVFLSLMLSYDNIKGVCVHTHRCRSLFPDVPSDSPVKTFIKTPLAVPAWHVRQKAPLRRY